MSVKAGQACYALRIPHCFISVAPTQPTSRRPGPPEDAAPEVRPILYDLLLLRCKQTYFHPSSIPKSIPGAIRPAVGCTLDRYLGSISQGKHKLLSHLQWTLGNLLKLSVGAVGGNTNVWPQEAGENPRRRGENMQTPWMLTTAKGRILTLKPSWISTGRYSPVS